MKSYEKYLNEKIGGFDIRRDEYDKVIAAIANGVVNDEQGLRQYVSHKTVQSGQGINIAKELAKVMKGHPEVLEKVMDLDALWDFDTADVEKVIQQLIKI